MLLSEAIRLGAMLRPQGRLTMFPGDASCALGAAMEAVGLRDHCLAYKRDMGIDNTMLARRTFPILFGAIDPIFGIAARNDSGWTREKIADWVEGIERERGLIAQTLGMLDVLQRVTDTAGAVLPAAPEEAKHEQ